MSHLQPVQRDELGFGVNNVEELRSVVFDLEVHWSSPCPNCRHVGGPRTHAARVEAMERLIVGGWLDPARRWPIEVPEFLLPLIRAA